jgi:hypothetical protein
MSSMTLAQTLVEVATLITPVSPSRVIEGADVGACSSGSPGLNREDAKTTRATAAADAIPIKNQRSFMAKF